MHVGRNRGAGGRDPEDPHNHPLRKTLLKAELLPYQLDGIAFAAGAGRAILADDMGLGKTIQGVGVAEMLAREAGIARCWSSAPPRSSRSGGARSTASPTATAAGRRRRRRSAPAVRQRLASSPSATTSRCCATSWPSERPWDLIILDEGQRIKNWESKTARVIKGLKSPFALVLSGTPLENRLDELYSVVQFVDDRRLPPGLPLLPPPPRGRREGQGARLQEPGPAAREPAADPAAPHARVGAPAVAAAAPPRSSASRPPTSKSTLHGAHMRTVLDDHAQAVHHRDGPAAAAERRSDVPHVGRQHVPGRQAERPAIRASWSTWPSCSTGCSPSRTARRCSSPSGPRCST